MILESKILAALSVPLAFPHLEAALYPNGRPDTWEGLIELGLTLERMVNRGQVHKRESGSVRVGDTEHSTTATTWAIYCACKGKLAKAVASRKIDLKGNA